MAKIIKLTESDLEMIINKVIKEQKNPGLMSFTPGYSNYEFNVKNPNPVELVQRALIKKGYGVGPTGADGEMGQNTINAIKKYQKDNGIKQTGTVGTITAKSLGVQPLTSGKPSTQTNTGGGNIQSKGLTKDPSDINSYPSCVRFSKPINDSSILNKIYSIFGGNYGDWFIKGTGFYEGYSFFNNGTYVSIGNSKKGTYTCNQNGKVILDIASKAVNPNTKKSGNYKYSPRIDAEVQHIKNRNMDDTPFFIYDPKENLIYLFDTEAKYVASSSVIDGADTQKGLSDAKSFTKEDWCKVSGLDTKPYSCTDPKTKSKKNPYYGVLSSISARFLPKGIYTINGLQYNSGYVGGSKGGNSNMFRLKPIKLDGTITAAAQKGLSAAIHGIPNISERLTASKDLQSLLKNDISDGKVPEKYLNNIKAITQANQSFGCIGIPESFVDNPKVQTIIKANINKIKVFALGEDSEDFLVKSDNKPFTGNNQSTATA